MMKGGHRIGRDVVPFRTGRLWGCVEREISPQISWWAHFSDPQGGARDRIGGWGALHPARTVSATSSRSARARFRGMKFRIAQPTHAIADAWSVHSIRSNACRSVRPRWREDGVVFARGVWPAQSLLLARQPSHAASQASSLHHLITCGMLQCLHHTHTYTLAARPALFREEHCALAHTNPSSDFPLPFTNTDRRHSHQWQRLQHRVRNPRRHEEARRTKQARTDTPWRRQRRQWQRRQRRRRTPRWSRCRRGTTRCVRACVSQSVSESRRYLGVRASAQMHVRSLLPVLTRAYHTTGSSSRWW